MRGRVRAAVPEGTGASPYMRGPGGATLGARREGAYRMHIENFTLKKDDHIEEVWLARHPKCNKPVKLPR